MTPILVALLVGKAGSATPAQLASILKSLSATGTWAQVKSALPAGTKITFQGFNDDDSGVANHVLFSGTVTGSASLLSQQQAREYEAWKRDAKATTFPAFPVGGSDRILALSFDVDHQTGSQSKYNALLKQLRDLLGPPSNAEYDKTNSYISVEWKRSGVTWSSDPNQGTESLSRLFTVSYVPKTDKGTVGNATNEDYTALSDAFHGKPQHRLCITTGQLFTLKQKGWTLRRHASVGSAGGSQRSVIGYVGPQNPMYAVTVTLLYGKRRISLAPLFE